METLKPTAVIIGASSGIGKALAIQLHAAGYRVAVAARRLELLEQLNRDLNNSLICKKMDICKPVESQNILAGIAAELGRIDLLVLSSGTGEINQELDWGKEQPTISTNVLGFSAIAVATMNFFLSQGSGHLVGISSIAALRGNAIAPAYNASKAFVSNYLEGLRIKAVKSGKPIFVTDIRPGFVDTPMAQGEGLFWVASPEKAAKQIISAIKRRQKIAYVTRRWGLVAWLLKFMPDFLYFKL